MAGHGYHTDGSITGPDGPSRLRTVSASSDDDYRGGSAAPLHPLSVIPERGMEWHAHVVDHQVVKDNVEGQHAVFLVQVSLSLEAYTVKRRFKRFQRLQREVRH